VILVAVTAPTTRTARPCRSSWSTSDAPGLTVHDGYRNVSHRGYTNSILDFDDVRVPGDALLGEEGKGFDLAGTWLGSTRLQVAGACLGRAERALDLAVRTPRSASSSARRSAGSRASPSSSPTWRSSCGPPS
jgi:alkylation response protein AidB-like acyl-CoA dehydrogenase